MQNTSRGETPRNSGGGAGTDKISNFQISPLLQQRKRQSTNAILFVIVRE